MAVASSVAMVVLLLASAVGWWSGRRLTSAANLELLRRRAFRCLVSAVLVVAAGTAHVGTSVLQWDAGAPGWAEPLRAALVGIPVLVALAVTVPRTWVVVRSRRSADPLHWPDGRLRIEVAGPELVVPFAATLLGALAVVLLPTAGAAPSPVQVSAAALAVLAVTTVVDLRQRQHRARVARPIEVADLRWSPVVEGSAAMR